MASTVVGVGTQLLTGSFVSTDVITSDPGSTNLVMGSLLNGSTVNFGGGDDTLSLFGLLHVQHQYGVGDGRRDDHRQHRQRRRHAA